jgi:hypothetical protein
LRTIRRKHGCFTNSRGIFDRESNRMNLFVAATVSILGLMVPAAASVSVANPPVVMAQAMVPATGMQDAEHPMPMADRMQRRFPQPVRVGDLIGLPILDDSASTIGYIRQVVRTSAGKIELVVSYSTWFGWLDWFGRPVAVPIEAVGIEGRQVASLDMPRSEYAEAATWQGQDATALPSDTTIRIALARN